MLAVKQPSTLRRTNPLCLSQNPQAAVKEAVKKKPVRPKMPAAKPNGKHMPFCAAPGCKRRVDDARRFRCGLCQRKTTGIPTFEDYEMYGMYGGMD